MLSRGIFSFPPSGCTGAPCSISLFSTPCSSVSQPWHSLAEASRAPGCFGHHRFNFQRGCGGAKGSPSLSGTLPGKGDRQALPKLNSPKQSRDPSRKDTDCLRNAGVQAVNDLLQLFLHAWSLEQVLLSKTAQGWSNSPSLQRLRHMVTHSEWGTLGHPASAPSTGKSLAP